MTLLFQITLPGSILNTKGVCPAQRPRERIEARYSVRPVSDWQHQTRHPIKLHSRVAHLRSTFVGCAMTLMSQSLG